MKPLRHSEEVSPEGCLCSGEAKLSTALKQTIPFGSRFLINPQNTYSGTEPLASPPRPDDTPLMRRASIAQVFGNEGTLSTTPADRHHGRGLRPPPGYHRGHRFHPGSQQQQYYRRLQPALAGQRCPPVSKKSCIPPPRRLSVGKVPPGPPQGRPSHMWQLVCNWGPRANVLRLVGVDHDGHQTRAAWCGSGKARPGDICPEPEIIREIQRH